jgi:predicted ester cyclase
VVDHNPRPGQGPGRGALAQAIAMFRTGLPDLEVTVEREVAEGDLVVAYGLISGTHTGELMGIPPTGKRTSFAYVDLHWVAGGGIVEFWHVEDIAGMLGQLGPLPALLLRGARCVGSVCG